MLHIGKLYILELSIRWFSIRTLMSISIFEPIVRFPSSMRVSSPVRFGWSMFCSINKIHMPIMAIRIDTIHNKDIFLYEQINFTMMAYFLAVITRVSSNGVIIVTTWEKSRKKAVDGTQENGYWKKHWYPKSTETYEYFHPAEKSASLRNFLTLFWHFWSQDTR